MSNGDAVSTNDLIYAVRKANVDKLVLDKFRGNKSAFARATMVHPNHINLLLSNNPEHRRNLGETLARKIEQQLGLPPRWLDNAHDSMSTSTPVVIDATPIHESLGGAIRTCDTCMSMSIPQDRVKPYEPRLTAVENLMLAVCDTHDLEPDIPFNESLIIDSGVKAITMDGVYVVLRNGVAMLRKFTRNSLGDLMVMEKGDGNIVISQSVIKSFKVVARVVVSLHVHHF